MFETYTADIVPRSKRTIRLHVKLRDDEERYSAASFGRFGQPGQNQMDDILGKLVLTPGYVDLLALDPIFARMLPILDQMSRRAQRADIGARLRLGQIHCAGPFPAHQIRQILLLQFV